MKIRNGFVSNSSSTSFVIAISPNAAEPCPHCGRKSGLRERIENGGWGGDTAIGLHDLSQILNTIEENAYDYPSNPDRTQKAVELAATLYGQGWEILQVRMSYHDDGTRDLLAKEEACGAVKIIICLE